MQLFHALNEEIKKNKDEGDHNNMDIAARVLVSLPRILLKSSVGFLKFLDYFGLLPRFLTKLSPFHGSLFITNMGSLGMPPIYHHLYNLQVMFHNMQLRFLHYYIIKQNIVFIKISGKV